MSKPNLTLLFEPIKGARWVILTDVKMSEPNLTNLTLKSTMSLFIEHCAKFEFKKDKAIAIGSHSWHSTATHEQEEESEITRVLAMKQNTNDNKQAGRHACTQR